MATKRASQGKTSRTKGRPVTKAGDAGPGGDRVKETFARFAKSGGKSGGTTPPSSRPVTLEVTVRLQAIALPEADGRYSVVVPGLPGCVTMGDTIEEARANVVDAAEGWLATSYDLGKGEAIRVARGEE